MAELTEEQLRIRGYLQSQAAKLSVAGLIEKVRADSQRLGEAAAAAAAVDIERRPADGEWSVNEVLAHICNSSRGVNAAMLAAAFEGKTAPALVDRIEPAAEVRQPGEWFEQMHTERENTFAKLAPLSGTEHLDVRWNHPFFGDLNWREWLLFLRIHDLDHAGQIHGIVESLQS